MEIKQISVFLENTIGRINEVTKALAQAGVSIRAISITDTADFGILRLIVDKTVDAMNALSTAGFTTRQINVIAVEIEDVPGSLAKLVELFQKTEINIEYLYASLDGKVGKAVLIFKVEDHDKISKIIKDNGFTMAERL
jgi:hypothetical protein